MEEQQQEVLSLETLNKKLDLVLSKLDARISPVEESVTDMAAKIAVLEEGVSKVVGDAKQAIEEELAAFEATRRRAWIGKYHPIISSLRVQGQLKQPVRRRKGWSACAITIRSGNVGKKKAVVPYRLRAKRYCELEA
ncbi:MAG: hypothetical protein GY787_03990 [Alteromonadales bacterium]|nr:hypothetical protein [Alteromonadales bacterium]